MTKPTPYQRPHMYLTEIPGRTPTTKLHKSLGAALNAVGWSYGNQKARGGEVWVYNETTNDWDLLYDIPQGTPVKDLPWRQ